jgi:tetrapyrrole methylase family protein/MazG family protein
MSITIIGLGPGDPGSITRAALERIQSTQILYLRTAVHPTIAALPAELTLRAFDQLYEQASDFQAVYEQIAGELIDRAATEDVCYAVPGDPLVAEASTRRILALARARGIPTRIISGVSFIEPVCAALELDPLEHGLQLVDALDFVLPSAPGPEADSWASLHGFSYDPPLVPFPLLPTRPALICQLYSRRVASDVKLSLMERYPAQHPISLVRAAGVAGEERVWSVPLHQLDHQDGLDHLTCALVPALAPLGDLRGPDGLATIVVRLLGPGGCPWDREQTPQSLRSALLAEAHEALEALDAGDPHALAEELGDLLMNILAQGEMARQAGDFGPGELYEHIATKLIRRHPHVFGESEVQLSAPAASSADVLRNWEAIKRAERATNGQEQRGTLDGIPPGLPALAAAQELARKAARAGFEWPAPADAWRKVHEEIGEIEAVLAATYIEPADRVAHLEAELGDLLLAAAVAARALGVDAESALRTAGARFRSRFMAMEQLASRHGGDFATLGLAEKLALWDEAKRGMSPETG